MNVYVLTENDGFNLGVYVTSEAAQRAHTARTGEEWRWVPSLRQWELLGPSGGPWRLKIEQHKLLGVEAL